MGPGARGRRTDWGSCFWFPETAHHPGAQSLHLKLIGMGASRCATPHRTWETQGRWLGHWKPGDWAGPCSTHCSAVGWGALTPRASRRLSSATGGSGAAAAGRSVLPVARESGGLWEEVRREDPERPATWDAARRQVWHEGPSRALLPHLQSICNLQTKQVPSKSISRSKAGPKVGKETAQKEPAKKAVFPSFASLTFPFQISGPLSSGFVFLRAAEGRKARVGEGALEREAGMASLSADAPLYRRVCIYSPIKNSLVSG